MTANGEPTRAPCLHLRIARTEELRELQASNTRHAAGREAHTRNYTQKHDKKMTRQKINNFVNKAKVRVFSSTTGI